MIMTNNNEKSELDQECSYLSEVDPMDHTYCSQRGKTKMDGYSLRSVQSASWYKPNRIPATVPDKDVHTETSESLVYRDESKNANTTLDCMTLLSYHEAPSYLQFNPYILSGYRGYLSTKMCFESMFWMTNETINIWSHVFGWMLFLGLTLYDLFLLNIHASFTDKFIVGLLLACFQVCMVMSSLYHIFSCRSEHTFNYFLSFDLLGIALSMLGIYMTGVYYAYWCNKQWQTFYLVTVCAFFGIAMLMQLPWLKVDDHVKMLMFVLWAAYGVVPTAHWTIMMGGLENPIVSLLLPRVVMMYSIIGLAFFIYITRIPERFFLNTLLLPRVVMMYSIIGLAFFIYITRIPERFFKGKVDYIGSSHQWWHFFVVVALYYWHNTGIKYIEYRMNHGCAYDFTL